MKRVLQSALCMLVCAANGFGTTFSVPQTVRQGEYLMIRMEHTRPALNYRVSFQKKWYPAYVLKEYDSVERKEIRYAFIPIDVAVKPGVNTLLISGFSRTRNVEIEISRPYQVTVEQVPFPQGPVTTPAPLTKDELKRDKQEHEDLALVYAGELSNRHFSFAADGKPFFEIPFLLPVTPSVSAGFGVIRPVRVGNQRLVTRHFGIDYPVLIGTSVLPVASGVVVFTGDLLLSGKTVVIDHGHGLISVYLHLSDIVAREGNMVTRANGPIGYSGNTGLRTRGPHLRVGMKLHGVWVNPETLLPKEGQ